MKIDTVTWHPSCKFPSPADPTESKQDAVVHAWAGALEIAADALDRFTTTQQLLANSDPIRGPSPLINFKIKANEPGYVQLFKLDRTQSVMSNIMGLWKRMNGGINMDPGTASRSPSRSGDS